MDFIVTSLIALGLAWVAVNILVGVAMFFFSIIRQFGQTFITRMPGPDVS